MAQLILEPYFLDKGVGNSTMKTTQHRAGTELRNSQPFVQSKISQPADQEPRIWYPLSAAWSARYPVSVKRGWDQKIALIGPNLQNNQIDYAGG